LNAIKERKRVKEGLIGREKGRKGKNKNKKKPQLSDKKKRKVKQENTSQQFWTNMHI
jgi:hypothetical protein